MMGSHGDVVGVLLSFDSGAGTGSLTFYKNGQNCGTAYDNSIPPGTYFPILSMQSHERGGLECVTTLNAKAKIPRGDSIGVTAQQLLRMEEEEE